MTETTAPPSIALLLLPESTPALLYGLQEVFGSVGLAWRDLTGEDTGVTPLEARIVANEPTGVKTAFGPVIVPDSGLDDFDLIITTDLTLDTSVSPRGRWPQEAAWLQRQFERGAMVCSVCTGAVLLAESGLLDGHTATTHWAAARLLRTHYPDVQVEPARIIALAGAEQRLITSGGSASWEDLALYLIDRLRGRQEAVRIAKIFLFGDRSEGQLPFTAAESPRRHDDALVRELQLWLADNYDRSNPVQELTARSGLPPRTLSRRFRAATGYSPIDYVQTLRLEEAKQLLEATATRLEDIPAMVGYEDPTHFRRLFKRRTGTTPAQYRRRYSRLFGTPLSDTES